MSGVDVLKVLHSYVVHWTEEAARTTRDPAINEAARDELAIARMTHAAVAELIEAVADEMEKTRIQYTYEEYDVAHRRLVSALSHMRGAE